MTILIYILNSIFFQKLFKAITSCTADIPGIPALFTGIGNIKIISVTLNGFKQLPDRFLCSEVFFFYDINDLSGIISFFHDKSDKLSSGICQRLLQYIYFRCKLTYLSCSLRVYPLGIPASSAQFRLCPFKSLFTVLHYLPPLLLGL